MNPIFIYLIYLLILCHPIYRFRWFRLKSLAPHSVLGLFLVCCGFSIFNVYARINIFDSFEDVFAFQRDAMIMLIYLKADFNTYWELLVRLGGKEIPDHLKEPIVSMSYWGNMSNYCIIRLYAIFAYISSPSLYNISIFFSFISFVGKFLMLKAIDNYQFSKKQYLALIGIVFFLPNESFWTLSMHKETLIMFCLGMIVYGIYSSKWHRWLYLVSGLIILFVVRDFYFVSLVPGLLIYYLINETKLSINQIATICLSFIFFLVILPIKLGKTLLEVIIEKKTEFASLKNGNTQIETLHFLENPVYAIFKTINNGFFEPNFFHLRNPFDFIVCAEMFLLNLLMAFFAYYIIKNKEFKHLGFYLFALIIIVSSGYLVPNIGAILRYKSAAYLILAFFVFFDYFRLKQENK